MFHYPHFVVSVIDCHDKCHHTSHCLQLMAVSAELMQRDAVIQRLSAELESTVDNRDSLQAEYVEQAAQLSSQVQLLQQQLKQVRIYFYFFKYFYFSLIYRLSIISLQVTN